MNTSRSRLTFWFGVCTLMVYVFLLIPIVVVVSIAFSKLTTLSFPPAWFSLRWFAAFLANNDFMTSFGFSAFLAFVTSLISTLIGGLAAYGLVRLHFPGQSGMQVALVGPLYVPRVLIGVSLLLGFAMVHMVGSFAGLLLGHVLITMPYALRLIAVGFYGMNRSTEEAAWTLGANRMQTFVKIVLPGMRSSILGAALFSFIISFTDLYLAMFLTGARTVTLPMRIFTYLEWNSDPLVAAVSAVQILLVFGVAFIVDRTVGLAKFTRF